MQHCVRLFVTFTAAMMKHLHYTLLFVCLFLGLLAILHEEQTDFRITTGSPAEVSIKSAKVSIESAKAEYSFSASPNSLSSIAHRPLLSDENNGRKISGILFTESPYNQANAPSKLLKLKVYPPTGQTQHLFPVHLTEEQSPNLFFTPSAIRYHYGYYVYALERILI